MSSSVPQPQDFIAEAREHLAEICDQLLNLERASGDDSHQRIERMLRATHSIKGGGGFLGYQSIERLAHRMEDALESVQRGEIVVRAAVVDTFLAATDQLAALVDDLQHSHEWDVTPLIERLDQLRASSIAADAVPSIPLEAVAESFPETSPSGNVSSSATSSLDLDLRQLCERGGIDVVELFTRLHDLATVHSGSVITAGDLRGPWGEDVPVVWRGQVTCSWTASELRERLVAKSDVGVSTPTAVSLPTVEPLPTSEPPATAEATTKPSTSAAGEAERGGTIRIPVPLIDRLMTLAGELVLIRNQTRRFAEGNLPLPGPVAQRLDAVTSEFQEAVLQTRMQPVGRLFGKFPRLIRDLARQFGKQIELEVVGSEVELDKTILDAISDPLMHLVRNACDHGIETPDVRQQADKSASGTIQLTARHLGDRISIEIRDDGRGIDRSAIRRQAIKQRLRTAEELDQLDDAEMLSLILLPGFSTAQQVTDISGRGVGMDVVKTNIDQLGGSLEITSTIGQGTTFLVRLPLTLAIIPCLLVTANGQGYAIPQKDLEELVCVRPGQSQPRIEVAADQEKLRLRGRLLPLVRLGIALRHPAAIAPETRLAVLRESRSHSDEPLTCAIVRAGSRRFGLVIESVVASEEIVVKPMHGSLRRLGMYSGVTILGDGQVALILDCEGLARHAGARFGSDAEMRQNTDCAAVIESQPALLLRNGPQEVFAVPLALLRRVVLVQRERIEQVGSLPYLTIDGEPTRLMRLDECLAVSTPVDAAVMFAVLPRGCPQPVGFLFTEILDTRPIPLNLQPPPDAVPGALGTAVVDDRLTLVLDLASLAARNAQRDAQRDERRPDASLRRSRVLVVDDTQFFRELISSYLQGEDYEVAIARDGQEALRMLDEQSFDLVVSDLEMPVMNGWEFAQATRSRPVGQRMPLLALTTLSTEADRQRALAAGFDDFQVKVNREEFLRTVARWLASGRRSQEAALQEVGGPRHG